MVELNIYDSTDFQEVDDIDDIKTFYRLLYKLNEATLLMSQAKSMSELYRTAIETATSLLDIDRIGVLLVDEQQEYMYGTWGTDEQGKLCNEYDLKSPVDAETRDVIKLLDNQGKVCVWDNKPLYEFEQNSDQSVIVGFGWNCAIALWENEQLIGWIACDNLIKHRPFKTYTSHVLRLFASVLSEYRLRFLAQEKIQNLNADLEQKVQQLQETITKLETTKAHLNNAQTHSAIKDLVVGVAHEINTPLGTAMLANSSCPSLLRSLQTAIKENNQPDIRSIMQSVQQTFSILDTSLQRTASLITDFKRLSTIEVESIPAERVQLDSWLKSVVNTIYGYEPQLQALSINIKTPSPSPNIMLHSEVLLQVIKELLFNAFLHSNKKEIVCVNLTLAIIENKLHLMIEDNGSGIAAPMQEKIFSPFITTGRSMGRKGLGLNVITNLVTFLLKGKISYFDSNLGGAGFLITSPLQPQNNQSKNTLKATCE